MEELHLAHMLRHRADKYGQREAFRYKQEGIYKDISWLTFKEQAEKLSCFLLSKGINKQDNIGIYSPNCPQWTISDLAILSCRAVVVPVYATATLAQLKYIVEETEMKVLFVGDDEHLEVASQLLDDDNALKLIVTYNCSSHNDKRVIRFDNVVGESYENTWHEKLETCLNCAQADDIATIIYTSGTTGEPKGAMLDHNNFLASFKAHSERLSLGENDVSLCFLPLSHIFERAWTFFLLYSGGVNVYNPNPKKVIEELPIVKPTVLCVVPRFFEKTYDGIIGTSEKWSKLQKNIFDWALSVGHEYINYQKEGTTAPFKLRLKRTIADKLVFKKVRKVFGGNIKYMPCSGAGMSSEHRRFFHALGIFVNYGYGATETLATVSCMRHDKYDFEYTGDIMPGVDVKISDNNMILVKGETVFKGYYKKPKQTAKVLKDGWYHTGDQGKLIEGGKLLMTERIKDIIKTSTGKYVSPQKIELLLSQSEMIEQMCVIGDNRQYLTALIVPSFERIVKHLPCQGKEVSKYADMVTHDQIIEQFQKTIKETLCELPSHEQVAKFALLHEPFTIENEMLTSSMKVRRKQVTSAYEEVIEELY